MEILTASKKNTQALQPLNVFRIISICALTIFFVLLTYGSLIIYLIWPLGELKLLTISQLGTLGDSFGVLNCLFTGLGFAGLLTTIFLQREDLKLTRIELSETRSEIQKQSQTFIQQQFDESFYKLLNLYRENLSKLTSKNKSTHEFLSGVDALSYICKNFNKSWKEKSKIPFPKDSLEQDEYTLSLYEVCRSIFLPNQRYVETFNALLSLIQDECFSDSKKEYYCNILFSQLTVYEVKYLFYQAFLSKDNHTLRSAIVNSTSFQNRLYYSGIATPQLKSFEHLWEVTIPKSNIERTSIISSSKFEEARERIKKKQKLCQP